MGILGRLFSIGKGKANDAMDSIEDKNMDTVIRQTIREMEEELAKTVKASAEAMGSANQIQKQYDDLKRVKKDWEGKAKSALDSDKEDLALKALERVEQVESQMKSMEPAVKGAKAASDNLRKKIDIYKAKLAQAKNESKTLVARNHAAEAQKKLAAATSNVGGGVDSAFSKLERFKDRVDANEAEADAWEDLSSDPDQELEDEFAALGSSSAKDRLSEMKAKLGK